MSSAAFRALAESSMDPADAGLLAACTLDPDPRPERADQGPSYGEIPGPSGCNFIDQWRQWERTLRLCLARFRAQKTKREGGSPVDPPEYPADAAAAAKAAMAMDNPLEAEFFLDKARWDAIDALQGLQYFSRNTIYAYLLKLLLLERRSAFKTEEGFTEYKGLYASIMEAASNDQKTREN
jgi:hypothetical protein